MDWFFLQPNNRLTGIFSPLNAYREKIFCINRPRADIEQVRIEEKLYTLP